MILHLLLITLGSFLAPLVVTGLLSIIVWGNIYKDISLPILLHMGISIALVGYALYLLIQFI